MVDCCPGSVVFVFSRPLPLKFSLINRLCRPIIILFLLFQLVLSSSRVECNIAVRSPATVYRKNLFSPGAFDHPGRFLAAWITIGKYLRSCFSCEKICSGYTLCQSWLLILLGNILRQPAEIVWSCVVPIMGLVQGFHRPHRKGKFSFSISHLVFGKKKFNAYFSVEPGNAFCSLRIILW